MPARTPIRSATRQSSQLSFGFVQFAVLAQVRCSALRVNFSVLALCLLTTGQRPSAAYGRNKYDAFYHS